MFIFQIDKLIYIFALILGIASVYYIKQWTAPPPMPEVDLDEYWGTYPMDVKPDVSIKPYKIEFSDAVSNNTLSISCYFIIIYAGCVNPPLGRSLLPQFYLIPCAALLSLTRPYMTTDYIIIIIMIY